MADEPPEGVFTDWLANCSRAYGFGYTAEQAIATMAMNAHGDVETYDVDLYEHTGGCRVSPLSVEFDGEVFTHKTVEVDAEEMEALSEVAFETESRASNIVSRAEETEP